MCAFGYRKPSAKIFRHRDCRAHLPRGACRSTAGPVETIPSALALEIELPAVEAEELDHELPEAHRVACKTLRPDFVVEARFVAAAAEVRDLCLF